MQPKPASPDLGDSDDVREQSDHQLPPETRPELPSGNVSTPAEWSVDVDLDSLTLTRLDRARLRRRQRRCVGRDDSVSADPTDHKAAAFLQDLGASVRRGTARAEASPRVEYPDDLPVSGHRDRIVSLLQQHQVLVVCGETGSGKSTQLPKMCLEAGFGRAGWIGHTQPRRLAARSIAARLAEETDTVLGQEVGYQIRFGDQTSDRTLIKLMTDGILLAETGSDPDLLAYDVLIIDEAHERSLNVDFLIGYLRRLIDRRPELRVIITSATIDAARFAEHFAGSSDASDDPIPAPVVSVEGRGYPVELRYLPWEEVAGGDRRRYELADHVIAGLESLRRSGNGDTLVFLPTERDIREVSHQVRGHYTRLGLGGRVELLPLYARLPQSEQQAIFHPTGGKPRVIFATNVAESSLTVPGIRYVIDTGTARISRYSPRSKLQRLPIESVSRASANQRAGRCGRVGPGICVRLFDEEDFLSRPEFTTPEIRRTNLASVILQSKMLRLGPLDQFPLLDPPREDAIREGLRTLSELGAIDDRHELTDIGKRLGRMPVDPRVGRILVAAVEEGVLPEVLPIAAAMEIQDPRDRPPEKKQAADEAHASFADPDSDFLASLRLWRWHEAMRSEHSRSKLIRIFRQHFLSPNRMREWSDVYRQLREMAASNLGPESDGRPSRRTASKRLTVGPIRYAEPGSVGDRPAGRRSEPDAEVCRIVDEDRYAAIHRALLTGLLSGVAMAGDKNEYTGAGGLKLYLWPGSGVFEAKPKWIVAAELVETSKQYARTVARVQPSWIEAVAGHLLKASYSDPHWSRKSGGAFCYQRLSLSGLPIVVRRRVPLAPVDPDVARDLLISEGLVKNELPTTAESVRHNRKLIESIERLAAKTRRRDLVVDDYTVQSFYQTRLPDWVVDRARLEKFDRQHERPAWAGRLSTDAGVADWLADPPDGNSADESTPFVRVEDVLEIAGGSLDAESYPDELPAGASRLPLHYRFQPGTEEDGIQLTVHQAALPQISDDALGWLVPGLLHDKIVSMIKSLPKRLRRNLVPAAEVADRVAVEIADQRGQAPFLAVLCDALTRHADVPIRADDFQAEKLAPYLQFLVRVVDDEGKVIAQDRGVDQLKRTLQVESTAVAESATEVSSAGDENWHRQAVKTWDLDELPAEVLRHRGGVRVAQYPGLVDQGDSVSTALFADAAAADASSRLGLMRLLALEYRRDLRVQVRHLPTLETAKVKLGPILPAAAMESSLADLIVRLALTEDQPIVRTRGQWDDRRRQAEGRIAEATQEVATWLAALTDAYHGLRCRWEEAAGSRLDTIRDALIWQLEWLVFDGFVSTVPWGWLKHYPRYLEAMAYRIDKVRSGAAARDAEGQQIIDQLWQRWQERLPEAAATPATQATSEFRWMIEELRVSQFAQPLGTAIKISPQRCEKRLEKEARPGR